MSVACETGMVSVRGILLLAILPGLLAPTVAPLGDQVEAAEHDEPEALVLWAALGQGGTIALTIDGHSVEIPVVIAGAWTMSNRTPAPEQAIALAGENDEADILAVLHPSRSVIGAHHPGFAQAVKIVIPDPPAYTRNGTSLPPYGYACTPGFEITESRLGWVAMEWWCV